jgi:cell division protein FtsI/penicillin-binding protein 2
VGLLTRLFEITAQQLGQLQGALAGVVNVGTARGSRLEGIVVAGKTGTTQNAQDLSRDHSWFVGYAPAEDPKIVVALMIEFGGSGSRAARVATRLIEHYLNATVIATDAVRSGQ